MPHGRTGHAARRCTKTSPRSAKYLIIAGGGNGHRGLGDTHVFDSAKRAWLEMGAL